MRDADPRGQRCGDQRSAPKLLVIAIVVKPPSATTNFPKVQVESTSFLQTMAKAGQKRSGLANTDTTSCAFTAFTRCSTALPTCGGTTKTFLQFLLPSCTKHVGLRPRRHALDFVWLLPVRPIQGMANCKALPCTRYMRQTAKHLRPGKRDHVSCRLPLPFPARSRVLGAESVQPIVALRHQAVHKQR